MMSWCNCRLCVIVSSHWPHHMVTAPPIGQKRFWKLMYLWFFSYMDWKTLEFLVVVVGLMFPAMLAWLVLPDPFIPARSYIWFHFKSLWCSCGWRGFDSDPYPCTGLWINRKKPGMRNCNCDIMCWCFISSLSSSDSVRIKRSCL